jgi:hypothetical protein
MSPPPQTENAERDDPSYVRLRDDAAVKSNLSRTTIAKKSLDPAYVEQLQAGLTVEEIRAAEARKVFDDAVAKELKTHRHTIAENEVEKEYAIARRRRKFRRYCRLLCRCVSLNGTFASMGAMAENAIKGAIGFAFMTIWVPYLKDAVDLTNFSVFTNTQTSFWVPFTLSAILCFAGVVVYESRRWYNWLCTNRRRRIARVDFAELVRQKTRDPIGGSHTWRYFSDDDPVEAADYFLAADEVDDHHQLSQQTMRRWFVMEIPGDEIPMMRTFLGIRRDPKFRLYRPPSTP